MRVLVALIAVCLLGTLSGVATATDAVGQVGERQSSSSGAERSPLPAVENESASPEIVDLYPNPPAHGDPDEFVTVSFPAATDPNSYTLTDRYDEVELSIGNRTLSERTDITFSTDPERTRQLTDRTVAPLDDEIQLADRGDRVELRHDNSTVDTISYGRATEGAVFDARADSWHALNATERPIVEATGGNIEAFVLPDENDRTIELLDSAEDRIALAGYTLGGGEIVETLIAAHERGVTVELLVEGSPVGGMGASSAAALDTLDRAGIDVRVIDGDHARYRFHHAKYAVVDDRALVTSENWKPSGTGGQSSRGWAAITEQDAIVAGLTDTFHADTGWVDAIPWSEFDPTLVEDEQSDREFPTAFEAESFTVDRTELLVAPENAKDRMHELIEEAEESIRIKQVRISDVGFPLLQSVLDAGRRGVEVEILLAGSWYVAGENEQLRDYLTEQAEIADLPVEVRVAESGDAFEKIHAKGLIVDEETTVVGSINWTNTSVEDNREAALLIESAGVAAYFGAVFEADWNGPETDGQGDRAVPVGLALAALAGTILAILGARRLEWASR